MLQLLQVVLLMAGLLLLLLLLLPGAGVAVSQA
jgi:hypothetical protein